MKWRSILGSVVIALALPAVGLAGQKGVVQFTTDFRLEDCKFKTQGDNPYFPLRAGNQLVLEEEDEGEVARVEITVLNEFEKLFVPGLGWVTTRVVQEVETVDEELVEISRNFFAVCSNTNDVVYFGEDVDIFHEDGSVTHEGAWRAGQPDADGLAQPGLIMPGTWLLGARYFQEIADGIALDRAEHVEMGLEIETEAGTFQNCVRIVETTPLEPTAESEKVYCPGIGLVNDSGAELVEYDVKK